MNIEPVKQQALEYLLQHGHHPQAVHCFGTKGSTVTILEDIPADVQGKQQTLFTAGSKTAQNAQIGSLQSLFLVSEAWVSLKPIGNTQTTAPAADPERKETLVVYGIDMLTKEQRMFVFKLLRDQKGIVRTIQPLAGHEEIQAVSNPFLMTFLTGYLHTATLKKSNSGEN
jgi:hypothetical protein